MQNWILCDFHIHTTNSDGSLTLDEVVDLYGRGGFDAINISDHILDTASLESARNANKNPHAVLPERFSAYQEMLWRAAQRAWREYGMLVIPGAEITNNTAGYHILSIDIKSYIEPNQSVEDIVAEIHRQGGVAVAPHPHRTNEDGVAQLMHLWDNHERYVHHFDAWEVANRDDLFNVVGLKKFNYIADSDFHEPRHLYSWKTLLRCEKNTEAIKEAIRINSGVSIYLFREGKKLGTSITPPEI
ncbi:MAG: phosphotransferase [Chitinivibrionales bacterium]|nr:phosphotransferase [Chitinivibrionales bacterium]MBD3356298.1 phosphotransferase [Chitinivibrionales bacterium]